MITIDTFSDESLKLKSDNEQMKKDNNLYTKNMLQQKHELEK